MWVTQSYVWYDDLRNCDDHNVRFLLPEHPNSFAIFGLRFRAPSLISVRVPVHNACLSVKCG